MEKEKKENIKEKENCCGVTGGNRTHSSWSGGKREPSQANIILKFSSKLEWMIAEVIYLDHPASRHSLCLSSLSLHFPSPGPGREISRLQVAWGIGNKARRASELLVQSMTGLGIWATQGGGLTIPIIITDTRKRMQHVGDAQRAGLDGLGFDRRPSNITISPYTSGGSN